ncbi:hypothetical protein CVT24_002892, partial [Panaeolus cyanescens]
PTSRPETLSLTQVAHLLDATDSPDLCLEDEYEQMNEMLDVEGFQDIDRDHDSEKEQNMEGASDTISNVDTISFGQNSVSTHVSLPASAYTHAPLPDCVRSLQQDLIGNHQPDTKPTSPPLRKVLDPTEILSLQHYIAWRNSNGTVHAYNEHRRVLADATGKDILSLHNVRTLALEIAKLEPKRIDMCRRSCMAYTGPNADLDRCPYVHGKEKHPCNEPQFKITPKGAKIPQAQVTILPILPTFHALFANADTSRLLRDEPQFSDFANGAAHRYHHSKLGLFQDKRDIALALSSDGAQLTMKKQSSTWILNIVILNLPPEIHYHSNNVIINFAIPGPNTPGDIESFMRPLFEELAMAATGLNGMSGHSAIFGNRFSMVQGARSSTEKGAKAQYYPLSPPQNEIYNPTRPSVYSSENLVMRQQDQYMKTLTQLSNAQTKRERSNISKETGVSHIPLAVASPAFIHPQFFPIDPSHLFYKNCMAAMYDTWTTGSSAGELVYISTQKMQKLGAYVQQGNQTLPPSFCGPVRNPYLKRQSQYKGYKWMALLHWYILPIGIELGLNPLLLENFSLFVQIVEFAMTIKARSLNNLCRLQSMVWKFLDQYQKLYVGLDSEKIYRCRLCIFQLVHVPIHIRWFGSIRTCSQTTVERTIGEAGHKIHSKKEPFSNLTNIIIEKEVVCIVKLYHPTLSTTGSNNHITINTASQHLYISKNTNLN